MRTSSFSNPQVIDVLTRYFVPVWLSTDEYGTAPTDADRAEWQRIQKTAHGGNIYVYLVSPDGRNIGQLGVTEALHAEEQLLPLLRKAIDAEKVKPRDAADIPKPREVLPKPAAGDGLALHLWTQGERGRADEWIVLAAADAAAFAPPAKTTAGATWQIPRATVDHLFRYFYPPIGNYPVTASEVHQGTLTATAVAVSATEVRLVFTGALVLRHDAASNGTMPARMESNVIGVGRYDRNRKTWTMLQLATDGAQHIWYWQGKPSRNRMGVAVELDATAKHP